MKRLGDFRDLFKQSIQFRLTCYFIMILLPLISFSLFANDRSQRILEQELGERTMSAMGSALEYVDLTIGGVKSLSTLLSTDRSLTSLLNHDDGETLSTETLIDFSQVMEEISNIAAVNPSLSSVAIYHGNTGRLLSSSIGSLHRPQAAEEQWYRDVVRASGSYILYLPDRHEESLMGWADPVYNESQIVLMQRMDLYSREKGNNVLMLSVPKSKLLGYLMSLVPSAGSHVYLLDNAGRLIVTNAPADRRMDMTNLSEQSLTVREAPGSEQRNMVVRVDSPSTGWTLILEQPEREIYKKSKPLEIFSYWIILISCLLAVWISWLVYSGIASPISSLVSGMRQLRLGKLDTKLANNRQDELGYLTDAFNQTVEQQRHLIRDIYEQQLRLTKTELKFLQSQINPHFLYNTLDSIYWSAKNYDAEEISEMVLNLSKFFRLSLSKGREAFTVEETFSHLGYYIRVQQLRFVGQFTVRYDADPDSGGLYILKLILQPLVENAILHGLEKKKRDGELRISAELQGDRLILTVSDNGKGIGEDRMERIRTALAGYGGGETHADAERNGEFFGLRNVKSRIGLYYGDTAEFTIDSEEGAGTTACIDLPADRCRSEWEGEVSHESDDRRR
ncbi:sensor histidine kinase [Paenibacillus sp. LHD-117]|uniref:sensor histidine kinase n=1 Tax=Paenibacillus sp. LHD-117 TaxID=3071412 RepID=UPI0027E20A8A|nr:sensor histidine kinase [Paenibacillus sp. LHD-117]MDQ6422404.1 sensor histidine kinase [Paenibacillus sp. LHD-117]